jgi:hypothetical protein
MTQPFNLAKLYAADRSRKVRKDWALLSGRPIDAKLDQGRSMFAIKCAIHEWIIADQTDPDADFDLPLAAFET